MNENMNQLSRELLQRGTLNDEHILDRIFYRQFLPAKHFVRFFHLNQTNTNNFSFFPSHHMILL